MVGKAKMTVSRWLSAWLMGALVAVTVLDLGYSQQTESTRRYGAGGFTGFGGAAGGYGGGLPERVASLTLLLANNDRVQQVLKLSPEQVTSLKQAQDESQASLSAGDPNVLLNLPGDEQRKAAEEFRARRDAAAQAMRKRIEAVLKPQQLAAYDEIALQAQGIEALADPEIIKKLGITEQQISELSAIARDVRGRPVAILQPNVEDRRAKMSQLHAETKERVLAVLTPKQKASFEKLQGEKLDIELVGSTRQPRTSRPRPNNNP